MTCRICKQQLTAPSADANHTEQSPLDQGLCLGCWFATVELEKFLIRATDRTIMGNWTEGWLREIISDPRKHL